LTIKEKQTKTTGPDDKILRGGEIDDYLRGKTSRKTSSVTGGVACTGNHASRTGENKEKQPHKAQRRKKRGGKRPSRGTQIDRIRPPVDPCRGQETPDGWKKTGKEKKMEHPRMSFGVTIKTQIKIEPPGDSPNRVETQKRKRAGPRERKGRKELGCKISWGEPTSKSAGFPLSRDLTS